MNKKCIICGGDHTPGQWCIALQEFRKPEIKTEEKNLAAGKLNRELIKKRYYDKRR